MNGNGCPHEQEVLQAARSGEWQPELAVHVGECSDCADLALVSGMFQLTEPETDPVVNLAQAGLIWARADVERRRQLETRALLPVVVAELTACIVGGTALVAAAVNYITPLSNGMGTADRLLADPVVTWLAPVAALLLLGVGAVGLVLAIGFRTAKA